MSLGIFASSYARSAVLTVPTIVDAHQWVSQSGGNAISATTHNVEIPEHDAGDRLLLLVSIDGGGLVSSIADLGSDAWAYIGGITNDSNQCGVYVYEIAGTSDADALSTVLVTLDSSEAIAAWCLRIVGSDLNQATEVGGTASGTSSGGIDFTSMAPTWGASNVGEETLFIVAASVDSTGYMNTAPAGFGDRANTTPSSSSGVTCSYATLLSTAASVDPDGGTITGFDGWAGIVCAIKAPSPGGTSYEDAVVAQSPLVYWRLGESSGTTATDASGNGRDGIYYGTYTQGVTGLVSGDADTAVSFPGSGNNAVYAVNAAWLDVSALTAVAIIKPDVVTGTRAIMGRWSEGSAGQWLLYQDGSSVKFVNEGPNYYTSTAVASMTAGNTYFVAGWTSASSAGVRVYDSNGLVASGSTTAEAAGTGAQDLRVATGVSDFYFDGTIDEPALFDSVLSSSTLDDLADLALNGVA